MSDSGKIPTEEEFEKASHHMKESSKGLEEVCEAVLENFRECASLDNIFLFHEDDYAFRAFVFFETDRDLGAACSTGVDDEIKKFVFRQLENVGRGRRDQLQVEFEMDSFENVKVNYEGNYFLRLR